MFGGQQLRGGRVSARGPTGRGATDGGRVQVGHAHQLHPAQLVQDPGMVGAHHAQADDRSAQVVALMR